MLSVCALSQWLAALAELGLLPMTAPAVVWHLKDLDCQCHAYSVHTLLLLLRLAHTMHIQLTLANVSIEKLTLQHVRREVTAGDDTRTTYIKSCFLVVGSYTTSNALCYISS
jgi:hypothetical protein